ncbi:MAG: DMT family transporter [Alphaproteobacteria bacterium]|nr:DMT family transporter [Alphaproteobacteria bacterium]
MSLDRAAPLVPDRVPRRPDIRGLLLMALAFFLFAAADTQAKFLTGWFHPMQIVWTRQLGLLTGVLVLLILKGPSILKTRYPGLQVLRGMLAVVSATAFIFALRYVPLADAVAVSFVAPFMVTIMGALFLGEKVGLRRWSAVTIGFIGTLIVIRPGLGVIHPAVFLVRVAATAFARRPNLSRVLAAVDRTATTVTYTAIASVLLLSAPLPFFWKAPEAGWELALLIGMAACAALGELLVIRALEIAQAIVLAPVHYSLIIWGTFYGWLVFDQLPDRWTWLGAAIIVATGLYILGREWKLARHAARD